MDLSWKHTLHHSTQALPNGFVMIKITTMAWTNSANSKLILLLVNKTGLNNYRKNQEQITEHKRGIGVI